MSRSPQIKDLVNPLHFLSFGCGSGLLKPAPGTWGTLAALPFWWFFIADLNNIHSLIFVALSFVIGVFLCSYTADALGSHDHGAIVWDEFVGVWITLLFFPKNIFIMLLGFALFRYFDIVKPFPIKQIDKYIKGGFGIMVDDLIAGVFAALCLYIIISLLPIF